MSANKFDLESFLAERDPLRRVRDAMAALRVVEQFLLNKTPELTAKQAQGLLQQAGRQLVTVNRTFEEIPPDTTVVPQPPVQEKPYWCIGRTVEAPGKPPRMEYFIEEPSEDADLKGSWGVLEGATKYTVKSNADDVRQALGPSKYPTFVRSYRQVEELNDPSSVFPPEVVERAPTPSRPSLAPMRTELPPPPAPPEPAPVPKAPEPLPSEALSQEEALHLVRQLRRVDKIVGPWVPADPSEVSWECQELLNEQMYARVEVTREGTLAEMTQWKAIRWYNQKSPKPFPSKEEAIAWCMQSPAAPWRIVYLQEMP